MFRTLSLIALASIGLTGCQSLATQAPANPLHPGGACSCGHDHAAVEHQAAAPTIVAANVPQATTVQTAAATPASSVHQTGHQCSDPNCSLNTQQASVATGQKTIQTVSTDSSVMSGRGNVQCQHCGNQQSVTVHYIQPQSQQPQQAQTHAIQLTSHQQPQATAQADQQQPASNVVATPVRIEAPVNLKPVQLKSAPQQTSPHRRHIVVTGQEMVTLRGVDHQTFVNSGSPASVGESLWISR